MEDWQTAADRDAGTESELSLHFMPYWMQIFPGLQRLWYDVLLGVRLKLASHLRCHFE